MRTKVIGEIVPKTNKRAFDPATFLPMLVEIERLKFENETLKSNVPRFKISERGAVSVTFPKRKFPITMYKREWKEFFEALPALQKFLAENDSAIIDQ